MNQLKTTFNKINAKLNPFGFYLLFIIAFSHACKIAFRYAHQVPLDWYSFRQTQTALTAYWLKQNGFSLAYETPVGGAPWSIPFEFPIYQMIVALTSQWTGCDINIVGRLVSFLFLCLCLWPAWSVVKKLNLQKVVFWIFATLLLSSPTYVYWGRTFMMETTALFFTVAAIPFFIDLIQKRQGLKSVLPFLFFSTLAMLQKVTTGFPILFLFGCTYLIITWQERKKENRFLQIKDLFNITIYFVIPLAIAVIWTRYTDVVKLQSMLGSVLTSKGLSAWNWGTIEQRFSEKFYVDLIISRIFSTNTLGIIGVAVILFSYAKAPKWSLHLPVRSLIAFSILATLLPLYLFPNLHMTHDYYQAANILFILFALALALAQIPNSLIIFALTTIIFCYNVEKFRSKYKRMAKESFPAHSSRDVGVGKILQRETPRGSAFIAYGNDWSSSFSYMAERKSFTVAYFVPNMMGPLKSPEKYLGNTPLSAMVLCRDVYGKDLLPTFNEFHEELQKRNWYLGYSNACYFALPRTAPLTPSSHSPSCEVGLDAITPATDPRTETLIDSFVILSGWTIKNEETPESVQLLVTKKDQTTETWPLLSIPREDINLRLQNDQLIHSGFSTVIAKKSIDEIIKFQLVRKFHDTTDVCDLSLTTQPQGNSL